MAANELTNGETSSMPTVVTEFDHPRNVLMTGDVAVV